MRSAGQLVRLSIVLSATVLAASCGTDSDDKGAASTGPSITITSPKNGDMVTAAASSPDVPVSFSVKNFTLRDHTVTSDSGAPVAFDSGALGSGGSFQFTFTSPGVVGYHRIPHAAFGMVGAVIVE
jgi:hypothetical protein